MLLLVILFFLLLLAAVFVFILALFIAHVEYLHLVGASSRWCSSYLISSLLEQMVLALCCSEPTTLYLDETVWLLSHWRYRSVCVGFLYTVVFRFPSLSGIIRTSGKGMEPSLPASSLVNWMCLSILFRCSRNLVFWDDCRMVKVSSTNLLKKRGDVLLYWWPDFPEEAMLYTGKSLTTEIQFVLILRKLTLLHHTIRMRNTHQQIQV